MSQQRTKHNAQRTKNRLRFWPWLAAVVSGVLLGLCYPKFDLGHLVWVWQLPLLAALWFSGPSPKPRKPRRKSGKPRPPIPRWRRGFALGYLAGLVFFGINVSWLFSLRLTVDNTFAGLAAWWLMAAYLALYFGLFGMFAATVGRWNPDSVSLDYARARKLPPWLSPSLHTMRIAALNAAAWCGIEWLRGIVFTGFGWNGLAVALHDNLSLIQAAELVGVTGLAFPLVFASCCALVTLARFAGEFRDRSTLRPHLDFAVAIALVIGIFLFGLGRLTRDVGVERSPDEFTEIRAAIVQLNLSIDEKWDPNNTRRIIERYRQFTEMYAESSDFDFIIWPETAVPGRFTYPWVQQYLNSVLALGDFHLLTGIEHEELVQGEAAGEFEELLYNTFTALRGDTTYNQAHAKIHLVPFGEFLPFRSFPPMEWIAGGFVPGDFAAGTSFEPVALSDPDVEIIPQICFEDTVGRLTRRFVDPDRATTGPQLIVTMTNNGWFWDSANIPQHLANARFRAIELRRPMARAANTGISCFINPWGGFTDPDDLSGFERVIRDETTGSPHITGVLPATLRIDNHPPLTLYARYGDTFSITLGLIALGAAIASIIRGRKRNAV